MRRPWAKIDLAAASESLDRKTDQSRSPGGPVDGPIAGLRPRRLIVLLRCRWKRAVPVYTGGSIAPLHLATLIPESPGTGEA